jgi:hypothetical protein
MDYKSVRKNDVVEVFEVPNLLKVRAAAPGGRTMDDMVESGNTVVSGLAASYAEVAVADISEIEALARAMHRAPQRADHYRPELMRVGLILKGQAATMGYPLLSEVATSLTDFLDDLRKYNRRLADDPKTALPAVRLHVEALRLLLAQGPTEADATAEAVLEGLRKMIAKALPEKAA